MSAPEPRLALGDSGDWVTRLQTRLKALSLFDGDLDGAYGQSTAAAVKSLQEHHGVPSTGHVDSDTWAVLGRAEQSAGLHDPFASAADPHAVPVMHASAPPGTLSEDENWRWDGERWEMSAAGAPVGSHEERGGGHVSSDGHWLWDGKQWQPVKK